MLVYTLHGLHLQCIHQMALLRPSHPFMFLFVVTYFNTLSDVVGLVDVLITSTHVCVCVCVCVRVCEAICSLMDGPRTQI